MGGHVAAIVCELIDCATPALWPPDGFIIANKPTPHEGWAFCVCAVAGGVAPCRSGDRLQSANVHSVPDLQEDRRSPRLGGRDRNPVVVSFLQRALQAD